MLSEFVFTPSAKSSHLIHIVDCNVEACRELSLVFRLEGFQTTFSNSTPSAISAMARQEPTAVLINLNLENQSGLSLLKHVKIQHMGIPVFMVADTPAADAAVTAMKLGAVDVFFRPFNSETMLLSVRNALRRNVQIGSYADGQRSVQITGFPQLTPREREVLQLITDGRSNKETGRELGISPRTVEVHRARVMEKIGARNTAELIRAILTS